MALSEGARAGTRTRLSSAGPPAAVFAHALVWLLHAGEMPPVEKKVEEMHVLGAPGTPARRNCASRTRGTVRSSHIYGAKTSCASASADSQERTVVDGAASGVV